VIASELQARSYHSIGQYYTLLARENLHFHNNILLGLRDQVISLRNQERDIEYVCQLLIEFKTSHDKILSSFLTLNSLYLSCAACCYKLSALESSLLPDLLIFKIQQDRILFTSVYHSQKNEFGTRLFMQTSASTFNRVS